MAVELSSNSYGKSAVRLFKVVRPSAGGRHEIRDLTVDVALSGQFAAAHVDGDNSAILPTDTMKNTVYAKAREHELGEPEEFALLLARHFVEAASAATGVQVTVREHGWRRLEEAGRPHDHAFERAGAEKRFARAALVRSGASSVVAGIEDLLVLKSAQSAFSGFMKDRYTTLKETDDRILATSITTSWRYGSDDVDYGASFRDVRRRLLETFAEHDSASVQHTLYAMAERALGCPEVEEVTITMPNKHHLLVDLTPFGLDNPNEIFVPTEAPYGLIEATLRRQG
jgi:urate oxidase